MYKMLVKNKGEKAEEVREIVEVEADVEVKVGGEEEEGGGEEESIESSSSSSYNQLFDLWKLYHLLFVPLDVTGIEMMGE